MIDLLFAGWRAAQLWSKWNETAPETPESSVEEVKRLGEMTEALYEDTQRLIESCEQQAKQIELLQRQLAAVFVLFLGAVIAIVWLAVRH